MKRITIISLLLIVFCGAMGGTIRKEMRMYSSILKDTVRYAVYLPDTYDKTTQRYPVFYLLHGLGDNHRQWSEGGDIGAIADKAIKEGSACEMIIVMPDAWDSWYVNSFDGKVRYEDMFIKELIPHIDATYKTRDGREYRSIGGLSMGGQGALLYSVKYPELFSVCGALSAAVYTDTDFKNGTGGSFPKLFARLFGTGWPNEYWKKNNVLNLMASMPEGQKGMVKFWIDCGDDDFLYRGNAALHTIMRDKKIPHQFRMRDGGHSWEYWRNGMPDILKYITISIK